MDAWYGKNLNFVIRNFPFSMEVKTSFFGWKQGKQNSKMNSNSDRKSVTDTKSSPWTLYVHYFELVLNFCFPLLQPKKDIFTSVEKGKFRIKKLRFFPYQASIKDIPQNFSRSESLPLFLSIQLYVKKKKTPNYWQWVFHLNEWFWILSDKLEKSFFRNKMTQTNPKIDFQIF